MYWVKTPNSMHFLKQASNHWKSEIVMFCVVNSCLLRPSYVIYIIVTIVIMGHLLIKCTLHFIRHVTDIREWDYYEVICKLVLVFISYVGLSGTSTMAFSHFYTFFNICFWKFHRIVTFSNDHFSSRTIPKLRVQ